MFSWLFSKLLLFLSTVAEDSVDFITERDQVLSYRNHTPNEVNFTHVKTKNKFVVDAV